jgi:hypothetical protein
LKFANDKKVHFYWIEIFKICNFFHQINNWVFPSFWVVLHIGIETKGYLKSKVMELVFEIGPI